MIKYFVWLAVISQVVITVVFFVKDGLGNMKELTVIWNWFFLAWIILYNYTKYLVKERYFEHTERSTKLLHLLGWISGVSSVLWVTLMIADIFV